MGCKVCQPVRIALHITPNTIMKTFKQVLEEINACSEALEWVGDRTLEQAWNDCHRGDWMLWLAHKKGVDSRKLTLAKARCARLIFHLMKDERSRNAVEVAEKYGLGEAAREELDAAAATATAAYAAYADDAAAAYAAYAADDAAAAYAAYAAYAAADDADDAYADAAAAAATATAAYAAYAYAATAAYAAYAAYAAADDADDAYADADDADDAYADAAAAAAAYAAACATYAYAATAATRKEILQKCSDICREVLTDEIITC